MNGLKVFPAGYQNRKDRRWAAAWKRNRRQPKVTIMSGHERVRQEMKQRLEKK